MARAAALPEVLDAPWWSGIVEEVQDGVQIVQYWWSERTGDEDDEEMATGPDARFDTLLEQAHDGVDTLPEEARDLVYLLVPGLMTERYPGYFDDNLARMAELGLDARVVDIDTDASVADNAEVVRQALLAAVEETGSQAVLAGHSKGGVDIAAALQLHPELAEHVRGVIAMQSPWGGTPIGDIVAGNETLHGLTDWVLGDLLGGDVSAVTDLGIEQRTAFNEAHPYPTDVPTVSLASSFEGAGSSLALPAALLREQYGMASDGLVPVESAVLPGSVAVHSEMDHTDVAMRSPGSVSDADPGAITQALITMLLEQPAPGR